MSHNAVIYVRISQDRAGERAGVTRQREDCEARAKARGWRVLALHEDNDKSAKNGRRRPGFEAMLDDISSGRVGYVIAWALDRLQRNRRDELRLYEACQQAGVTLSLINGPEVDFTTAAGRFVADSLGSVARLEVELKSDRQKRSVQQAVKAGRRIGGRRPFGYDDDGMRVRDDEAQAIRQGYEDLLSGVPLAAIARAWNAEGLTTGQGSSFTANAVRLVLSNARNAGLRTHRKEVMGKAVWPALVTEDTWRAAMTLLNDPARRTGGNGRRDIQLLTGIARCGLCEDGLVHAGGNARKGVRAYRCRNTSGHFARMADPVDDYVQAVVIERLRRKDARDLMIDKRRVDLAPLQAEATTLRARLDSLAVEFADGVLSASQLRTINDRINKRLNDIDQELADARRVSVLQPIFDGDDVATTWHALTMQRKRAIIDLLMTVTIYGPGRGTRTFNPDTVVIEWRQ